MRTRKGRAIVTLGDSITDGYASTVDANHRWPDYLADRIRAHHGEGSLSVVDQGISGNRLRNDIAGPGRALGDPARGHQRHRLPGPARAHPPKDDRRG